jgi:predicted TIM-barrel fold metal-dependent hydrolase
MDLAMPDTSFPPPNSCDCHVHVIGPKSKFPLANERTYTPMDATAGELAAMLKRIGLDRVVLVQPSFYRTDNSCMLNAMAALPNTRGVAVLPRQVSDDELDDLDERGVRGLRVNVATSGGMTLDTVRADVEAAARLCERHGWHVQIFVGADMLDALSQTLLNLPVATVVDHFGLLAPGAGYDALRPLIRLLQSGRIWVKISGAYRIADDPNDAAIGPLARALCKANPERIVWGSDWPHTPRHNMRPSTTEELLFQAIDTRGLLDLVPRWLQDDALVKRVLVTNPARLYGF